MRKDIFFPVKRRICISNGLDVPVVEQKSNEQENDKKRILFIAGLRSSKGVMDIIGTAEKLRELGADFVFDVAGAWQEEDTRRDFETELSSLNLNDHVILHGRVTGEEKWKFETGDSEFFPAVVDGVVYFGNDAQSFSSNGHL